MLVFSHYRYCVENVFRQNMHPYPGQFSAWYMNMWYVATRARLLSFRQRDKMCSHLFDCELALFASCRRSCDCSAIGVRHCILELEPGPISRMLVGYQYCHWYVPRSRNKKAITVPAS